MKRPATTADRVVNAVSAAVFMQWLGSTAVLPTLPLFLRHQHTSVGLVGLVMSAYFAAGVLTQYAAGHLADRVGHRKVMVAGLGVYAVASLGFLLSVSAAGYIGLRALQGVGAGALQLGGLALIGLVVPLQRRGRAFSRVFAGQVSGMAIGPLLGAVAGLEHMDWLFVLSAIAATVAAVPVLVGTQVPRLPAPTHKRAPLRVSRGFVGVLLVGVIGGLCTGVYETCWSLMMTARGGAAWQVSLSWTVFSVSFAGFSPLAGRLTDRLDRRRLAVWAAALSAGFITVYPLLPSPAWMIALGAVEAIGVAVAIPAAQSLLTQLVHAEAQGRAQGAFTTVESATIAVAAAVAGYLFTLHTWLPFVAAAVAASALTVMLPRLWRDVEGRAARAADELVAATPARPLAAAVP